MDSRSTGCTACGCWDWSSHEASHRIDWQAVDNPRVAPRAARRRAGKARRKVNSTAIRPRSNAERHSRYQEGKENMTVGNVFITAQKRERRGQPGCIAGRMQRGLIPRPALAVRGLIRPSTESGEAPGWQDWCGAYHGRKTRKVNQDCTICHSCRRDHIRIHRTVMAGKPHYLGTRRLSAVVPAS